MSRDSRSRSSYGVIFDVGSGSVGVGIVHATIADKAPEVIYAHREHIRIGETPTPDERVRAMRQALFAATLKLSETGLQKLKRYDARARLSEVLVVCAAPWSQTVTQIIHLEKDEPFLITEDWVSDLVEKAQKQNPVTKEADDILKSLGMVVVERSIVDIKVNGYSTLTPYGNEAREIQVAHTTGLVPQEVLDAVGEIEKNVITGIESRAHTYALVLYCVLRDIYPNTKDALIVDVTGEMTEVSIMHDEVLLETKTAPFGAFTLTREIARSLNTIPEEARAYVNSYKHIDPTDSVYEAVAEAGRHMREELTKTLRDLNSAYVLPSTVFVTIDPNLESFFTDMITPALSDPKGKRKPRIVMVGTDVAKQLLDAGEEEQPKNPDIFLAIAARFFHKLHACGETEAVI